MCACKCLYVCMHMRVPACMCVCVHACMRVCVCVPACARARAWGRGYIYVQSSFLLQATSNTRTNTPQSQSATNYNSLLSHHSSSVPVTPENPMLPRSMQPTNNHIPEASRVTCPYPWGPYEWGECDVQNTCGYQGAIGNCPQGQLCCATYHCGNICRWSVGY